MGGHFRWRPGERTDALREFRRPGRQVLAEIVEDLRAEMRGGLRPRRLGLLRGLDRVPDVLPVAEPDETGLAAAGIEDREAVPESGRTCLPPM
jgi:hypothetical protein